MQFTPGQQKALIEIPKFLNDPEKTEYLLLGFAGTGKTFLLNHILKKFKSRKILALAVSHPAKNILRDNLDDHIRCETVAKGLGLKQVFINGVEKYLPTKDIVCPVFKSNVIIIDECSMMDYKLLYTLKNRLSKDNVKVIYSGDSAQLPPVNEEGKISIEISPTFSIKDRSVLTEIVRYGDLISAVGKFYRDMIDFVDKGGDGQYALNYIYHFYPQWQNNTESIIYTSSTDWFLDQAIQDFSKDTLNTRIIAYRNETIDKNNNVIRPYFFNESEKYSIGEMIVLNRPYVSDNGTFFPNGTILKIIGKDEAIHEFSVEHPTITNDVGNQEYIKLKVWYLTVSQINVVTKTPGEPETVVAIHQDSEDEYSDVQGEIINKAKMNPSLWMNLNILRTENIFSSRYYCTSSHKAQGQSIKNTYVMMSDILDVEKTNVATKLRSLYVAITRSKGKCIVLI